jgi:hypothetical protein
MLPESPGVHAIIAPDGRGDAGAARVNADRQPPQEPQMPGVFGRIDKRCYDS